MAKTVVSLYERIENALDAVRGLVERGFRKADISLITGDLESEYARALSQDPSGQVGPGGLLEGSGKFTIPGVGTILAAGPAAGVLGTFRRKALPEALERFLVDEGVPEEDAGIYKEGVQRGGGLVIVFTDDRAANRAAEVMDRHEPVDIDRQLAVLKRNRWGGFNDSPEEFAFDRVRAASSRLDFGPGARAYLTGKPVSEYDRSQADLGNYQDDPPNSQPA